MIERVLELFAAVYAFSTIALLALAWASKTRADMDELECMKDFDRSCHENLALAKRKSEGLGSSSGRCRRPPVLQRFPSEDAERVAGNKMAR